ncbi:MAG: response regulator [Deltaproteobacteria bacterium]|nr:response regulator [Deltaproteobacteria bacterium]
MRTLLIVDDNVELASLLAVVAEVHGFSARMVHTGKDALAFLDQQVPEAALVDLLLPDMAGQDLLRDLRDKGVITFAMSGVFCGEHFAKAAIETHGARAYFEKPFTARDAMIKVAALVEVSCPSPVSPVPTGPEGDPPGAEQEAGAQDAPQRADRLLPPLEAMVSTETTGIFAKPAIPPPPPLEALVADSDAAVPPPESEPPPPDSGPAADSQPQAGVEEPAPEAAPPPEPEQESWSAPTLPEPDTSEPSSSLPFSGRDVWAAPPPMRVMEIPAESPVPMVPGLAARLLATIAERRASGELRLKRGDVLKVVGLKEGRIVFAASNLGAERLPRFSLRAGRLPNDRLSALQLEIRKGVRTQEALVSLGILNQTELIDLLEQLIREITWSLLDVEGGDAQFVVRAPERKGLVPLALEAVPLVLDGYRKAFTLVRLRELVEESKRYVQLPDAAATASKLHLSPGETTLFAAADGSKTVEDLVLLSELGEREALAALVGFTHLGLLEARVAANRRIVFA